LEEQRRAIGEAGLKEIEARSAKVGGVDSTKPGECQRRDLVHDVDVLCVREEEEDGPQGGLEEARRTTEMEIAGAEGEIGVRGEGSGGEIKD
jgi:hypothetical protein